ncbi:MAG: hypothetical protein WD971_04810 [Pirellulales bacterium]
MDKRNAIIGSVVVLLLAVGAAWALGYFSGDPVVAEMQQLRDQMFANRDLPEADRRAQWDNFRQRMDGLSDAQRDALRDGGRERWQQFGQQRMEEFFQLPPAEQQKHLDEMIDRMLERQQNPNVGRGPGGPGGRSGWGGGRNMTEAQRDQRRKEMISQTDPKMRAHFDQFRQMLGDRMKQRGLPPMEGGPGRGGPWRG